MWDHHCSFHAMSGCRVSAPRILTSQFWLKETASYWTTQWGFTSTLPLRIFFVLVNSPELGELQALPDISFREEVFFEGRGLEDFRAAFLAPRHTPKRNAKWDDPLSISSKFSQRILIHYNELPTMPHVGCLIFIQLTINIAINLRYMSIHLN